MRTNSLCRRLSGQQSAWLALIGSVLWIAAASARADGGGAGAPYVAMGSSFAAGPGVPDQVSGAPAICARSSGNYAHRLAANRGLTLDDVSCSGATTANILSAPQAGAAPQIEAVGSSTRLVTVTIGGNDVGYLGGLMRESCIDDPALTPAMWRPFLCAPRGAVDIDQAFARLPASLAAVVSAIRARSPAATIVLVDYVTVLPPAGTCPARSPLTAAQIAQANATAARLAAITARTARATGVLLVRASALTAGHDMCSADPWVFPYTLPSRPLVFGPMAYHPNAKAMAVIAAAVDAALPAP